MKRLLLLGVVSFLCCVSNAQLLSWTPLFPTENDPSQTLVITVDATKGNKGLLNYTPTSDVYVHIGVITNKSTSSTNWLYVPFQWGTTPAAANATYAGNNKWTYTITGSLRSFFSITDPTETIQKIAILFRNGSGSLKQANADGSDMYVPIYTSNLAVRIDQPAKQPTYTPIPEPQNWTIGSNFTFTANANKPSTMTLSQNGTVIASNSNVQTISANASVTVAGNQQLIASANDGANTTYDTVNIFVASSTIAALPNGVRDGINYEPGDTSVTLVLRAPGKGFVTVIGDFNNWTQSANYLMNKTPDGKFFWLRITHLTPSTEYAYQYYVDDTLKIADPYTEKILDPYNDQYISATTYPNLKPYPTGQTTGIVSVLQTAAPAYNWTTTNYTRPDKRSLVIYELLIRDFVAAHDWKTVTDSLHYLKTLGVNAIEIMPFNEFEGNNSWGYNPDFYFAPDKYYGPKNTVKAFIDSCHRNGIAVIMDIALNHSFGSSPMVQLYWDPANNRPAPNNPWFNPVPTHPYNVGYDMNHESPDTKYYFGRIVENWLQQYKLDGFRFDLAKGFTQTNSCTTASCNTPTEVANWSNYDASRIAIWKGYYDTIQNKSQGAYAILEHFAANSEETELSNYGLMLWGNMAYNYQQAAMGYNTDWDFSGAIASVRGWTNPYLVSYMESHDEERIVYKNETYGNVTNPSYKITDTTIALKRMEEAAAFLFTIPGPKMLWQFGELGYDYSINTCTNLTVNDSCRLTPKPIRWDYLNDAHRKHVHDTYAALFSLRFNPSYKDVFMSGTISKDFSGAVKWLKVSSVSDTSDLLVVGNFDVQQQTGTITFQTQGTWYDYLNNSTFTATGSAQNITLSPGEFHVFVNRNLNNNNATPVQTVPWNGTTLEARVFPNPVQTDFITEIKLPSSSNVSVDLYDVLGQRITTLYQGFLVSGTHQLSMMKANIAKGSYYLKISTKTATKTVQISF